MARGYRRAADETPTRIPWVAEMSEDSRERFRQYGRGIVTALVAALDTPMSASGASSFATPRTPARNTAGSPGARASGSATTTDLFLRFRRPFIAELGAIARRREFDADATSTLFTDANTALDDLLLATLRGWEAAATGRDRRPRRVLQTQPWEPS